MCRCTPEIRTPFCGKPGCEWPKDPLPWDSYAGAQKHPEPHKCAVMAAILFQDMYAENNKAVGMSMMEFWDGLGEVAKKRIRQAVMDVMRAPDGG